MEHFGPAMDQPPLDRIAQIATGDRGRSIAERIGAIGHRFVFKPEILMLQMHLIDAERLAAIIDRPATRTVGVGQRIALREEVALLIQRTEGFIADLVIEQHELAEVRSGPVIDIHLPAALGFRRRTSTSERIHVLRTLRFHDKGAEETHHGQFTVMAVGMELPNALLHLRMDVPLELLRPAGSHDGLRIRRQGRFAGRAHDHAGGADEQTAILALHLVAERQLDAVTLVGTQDQGLDIVALQAGRDGARIEALFVTRHFVLFFLGTDVVDIVGQHVHVAGVEIEPTVQRDLDVDHRHVELLGRHTGRTLPARRHHRLAFGRIRHEQEAAAILAHVLVHHRHLVERPGRLLRLCIFLRLLFELLHQTMVLHLHIPRTVRPTLDRILEDCLPLQLLGPSRHRDRCRMAPMRRLPWTGCKQPWRGHHAARQQHTLEHQRDTYAPSPASRLIKKRPHCGLLAYSRHHRRIGEEINGYTT
ncbi:MAG: hypothetical protein EWM72_03352 [Nitrospira sp.]|nr:MAG: hypothetical protein EWM72_03352 [Nitrospira sp.]